MFDYFVENVYYKITDQTAIKFGAFSLGMISRDLYCKTSIMLVTRFLLVNADEVLGTSTLDFKLGTKTTQS